MRQDSLQRQQDSLQRQQDSLQRQDSAAGFFAPGFLAAEFAARLIRRRHSVSYYQPLFTSHNVYYVNQNHPKVPETLKYQRFSVFQAAKCLETLIPCALERFAAAAPPGGRGPLTTRPYPGIGMAKRRRSVL